MTGITRRDRDLLKSVTGITKCDKYYKARRNKADNPQVCILRQSKQNPADKARNRHKDRYLMKPFLKLNEMNSIREPTLSM